MPLNIVVLSYPISVLVFTQVFIVQAITTRQSNQGNNSQPTTAPTPNHHQTTTTNTTRGAAAGVTRVTADSQFKATTTNSSKLIAYEYIVDQGKNFTSGCPVTDSRMVSFWFRTEDGEEGGRERQRTISWEHQLHRELRLRNVHAKDTGNYTCAVIRGYDGIAEHYADTSEGEGGEEDEEERLLWTVFGAEGNERRAKIILDSLEGPQISNPENLSTLVIVEVKTIKLRVRTVPAAVAELSVRPSTIIAVLIWAYPPKSLSFYQVRSFTAEFRRHPDSEDDSEIWERLDPINISPNIRQLEVYHLKPNETYDFQIWANNHLGPGDIKNVSGRTKSQYEEKDLIRLIMKDAKNFDTRAWIVAVGIVFSAFVILSLGICIVLYKEWQEEEDNDDLPVSGLDRMELVPNIILNPGFCDSDDQEIFSSPFIKRYNIKYRPKRQPVTHVMPTSSDEDDDLSEQSEIIPFKRKLSIFFTEGTVKRI